MSQQHKERCRSTPGRGGADSQLSIRPLHQVVFPACCQSVYQGCPGLGYAGRLSRLCRCRRMEKKEEDTKYRFDPRWWDAVSGEPREHGDIVALPGHRRDRAESLHRDLRLRYLARTKKYVCIVKVPRRRLIRGSLLLWHQDPPTAPCAVHL